MNIRHLVQQCLVVVKKRKYSILSDYNLIVNYILKTGNIPDQSYLDEERTKLADYEKARLKSVLYGRTISEKAKKPILWDPGVNDKQYFYLTMNGIRYKDSKDKFEVPSLKDANIKGKVSGISVSSVNADRVVSVSITESTQSPWTANVVINNFDDLYNLDDVIDKEATLYQNLLIQKNDCVIEENDEILIFLTDWQGNLQQSFTGFVNAVTSYTDGLDKHITLQCEDRMKLLSVSRTNINPSLDPIESEGNLITPYETKLSENNLQDIIAQMLGRVYSNVYSNVDLLYNVQSALRQLRVEKDPKKDDFKVKEEIPTVEEKAEAFKALQKAVDDKIKSDVIINVSNSKGVLKKVGKRFLEDDTKTVDDKAAFIIEGLDQDLYTKVFGNSSFDYLISDWRGNDQILAEIAQKAFFECFADQFGTIRFRPINVTLPRIPRLNSSTKTSGTDQKATIDYWSNYILTEDKSVYIIDFAKSVNDRAICTDITVSGAYLETNQVLGINKKRVIGPYSLRNKFGVRTMGQDTRIGITSQEALEIYGQQRLEMNNAEYHSATLNLVGNGALHAGNPIFVSHDFSVWYIREVTHSFSVGSDFTTSLSLSYRRRPLCYMRSENDFTNVDATLNKMVANKYMSKTYADSIINNEHKSDFVWGKYKFGNKDKEDAFLFWLPITNVVISGKQEYEKKIAVLLQKIAKLELSLKSAKSQDEIDNLTEQLNILKLQLKEHDETDGYSVLPISFYTDTIIKDDSKDISSSSKIYDNVDISSVVSV